MKRILLKSLLIVICSSAVVFLHGIFYQSPFGKQFDLFLLDYWFELRGPVPVSDEIVLISMDESSYQNLGIPYNQAWPRAFHVKLLRKLAQAGVKKVVFDVLFLGPGGDPTVDTELADAFSSVPTILGADLGEKETSYGAVTELLLPYKPFAEHVEAALVGLPEDTGVVRRFRLPEKDSDVSLRPLSFAAADKKEGESIPTAYDLINMYGPAGNINRYSYYQILEEEVPFPLEKLKNKIVFVGLELRSDVGPEQKDSFLTSYATNGRHFGVEIHATAASNLMRGDWIRKYPAKTELIALSSLLFLFAVACMTLRPLRAAYTGLFFGSLWLLGSFVAFKSNYFIPGVSVIILFGPTVYVASTLLFYLLARQNQRKLRKAFELYLSPHMAFQVTKDPSALGLGGQSVFATAVFTDIADFTKISETMSAEQVTQMLNDYFSEIVDIIFESQGTLIKFIGDAVFAIWGAPVKLEHHAEAALKAGIAIQERLSNAESLKRYPTLRTRIGIHSGQMVVGNLGSRKRFDFTAIGDSVNLTSRVEGLNKYLGTTILITQSIKDQLVSSHNLIFMGKAKLVGKSEAVTLYTMLNDVSDEVKSQWEAALSNFQQRAWDSAEAGFIFCIANSKSLEKAAEFYKEQLSGYRIIPPSQDWEGELVLHSK